MGISLYWQEQGKYLEQAKAVAAAHYTRTGRGWTSAQTLARAREIKDADIARESDEAKPRG